jgi:hypothetical protein
MFFYRHFRHVWLKASVLKILCGVDQLGVPFCQTLDLGHYVASSGIPILSKGRVQHIPDTTQINVKVV